MSNVIQLEDYLKEKCLYEQVIPYFHHLDPSATYLLENNNLLFRFREPSYYFYVFLTYIPRNAFTDKPTPVERFQNIKTHPRMSKGEWVTTGIYEIGESYHHELLSRFSIEQYPLNAIDLMHRDIQEQ